MSNNETNPAVTVFSKLIHIMQFFDFNSRSKRGEYLMTLLIVGLPILIVTYFFNSILALILLPKNDTAFLFLSMPMRLILPILIFPVFVRRLRDFGISAWAASALIVGFAVFFSLDGAVFQMAYPTLFDMNTTGRHGLLPADFDVFFYALKSLCLFAFILAAFIPSAAEVPERKGNSLVIVIVTLLLILFWAFCTFVWSACDDSFELSYVMRDKSVAQMREMRNMTRSYRSYDRW